MGHAMNTRQIGDNPNVRSLRPLMHDEAAAFEHVEGMLWANGPVCPHRGVVDSAYRLAGVQQEGISSHQLHRVPGITCKSAWSLTQRTRECMRSDDLATRPKLMKPSSAMTAASSRRARRKAVANPQTAQQIWMALVPLPAARQQESRFPRSSPALQKLDGCD